MLEKALNDPEKCHIGTYEGKQINFDTALDVVGFGRYNYSITITCGVILFAVNTCLYGVAYILPSAACDLNLNTSEKGLFTAISLFGVVVGLYMWGALADIYGRKRIILISLIISFIFNTVSIFIDQFWLFCLLQFLKGLFISGSSSTLYAYLGEFQSNYHRPASITWCSLFMCFALCVLPLTAWAVLTKPFTLTIVSFNILPWRLYLFLNCFPNIIAVIFVCFFPESPKYLLLQNKICEVTKILNTMYVFNTKKSVNTFPIVFHTCLQNKEVNTESKQQTSALLMIKRLWYQTSPLFSRQYIKNTALTCLIQFILFAISSGLLFWYPYMLHQIAEVSKNSPRNSLTICESLQQVDGSKNETIQCADVLIEQDTILQNLYIGIGSCIGCVIIGFSINLIGRKTLLVINMLIPAICCVLLIFIKHKLAINALFLVFLVPSGLCISMMNSIVVDIFPTQFKSMAMSLSLLMGRLGGAFTGAFTGLFLEFSCTGTFYFFGALLVGCTLLSLIISKSTRH